MRRGGCLHALPKPARDNVGAWFQAEKMHQRYRADAFLSPARSSRFGGSGDRRCLRRANGCVRVVDRGGFGSLRCCALSARPRIYHALLRPRDGMHARIQPLLAHAACNDNAQLVADGVFGPKDGCGPNVLGRPRHLEMFIDMLVNARPKIRDAELRRYWCFCWFCHVMFANCRLGRCGERVRHMTAVRCFSASEFAAQLSQHPRVILR